MDVQPFKESTPCKDCKTGLEKLVLRKTFAKQIDGEKQFWREVEGQSEEEVDEEGEEGTSKRVV